MAAPEFPLAVSLFGDELTLEQGVNQLSAPEAIAFVLTTLEGLSLWASAPLL